MHQAQQAVLEMVEAGGRTAQSFGLSRLFGQLYVYLYLSRSPRSLDELAAGLGVSKASVSIASRQLESWGAVRRVWIKGDRKDYYEAETDIGNLINGGLVGALNKKLESARIQIERSLQLLEDDGGSAAESAFLRQRLREADQRRRRIQGLLTNPLVKRLL
jgi:DNA-binding transcriptional regulator GbsR (MarR family)